MIYLWTFLAIKYTCRGGYIGPGDEGLFCGFFFTGKWYPCRADLFINVWLQDGDSIVSGYCFFSYRHVGWYSLLWWDTVKRWSKFIPFILQVAYVLATDYSTHHGPRPDGPSHATFKSAPGRFVALSSHIVIYAHGDSLPCRL